MHSIETETVRKLYWRILPLILACYVIAYLDRNNVGFAALQMNSDLGLTPKMYAFGGGIFFIGYLIFEVPSNWVIEKVGARRWITRIMVTWGLISGGLAFVHTPTAFYVLRFLLGVAEAGFLPGVILYVTKWFPLKHRNRVMGILILGVPLSFVVGAPISGWLMSLSGGFCLKMWQWLFIIEAIPAILLGLACFWFLYDRAEDAKWLNDDQRVWLAGKLAAEAAILRAQPSVTHASFGSALLTGRVWAAGLAYVGINFGTYGISLWLPQIIKEFGVSNLRVGFITSVPYAAAAIVMVLWTRHADRVNEQRWHAVLPCLLGALGLAASAMTSNPYLAVTAFAVATSGIITSMPTLWAVATLSLTGPAAAGGIAMVNSIGQWGGFGGPYLVGFVRETTQSFSLGMVALAACLVASAIILYLLAAPTRLAPAKALAASIGPGETTY
jgi:ACS family tartrate transporter-like MFS transporter